MDVEERHDVEADVLCRVERERGEDAARADRHVLVRERHDLGLVPADREFKRTRAGLRRLSSTLSIVHSRAKVHPSRPTLKHRT